MKQVELRIVVDIPDDMTLPEVVPLVNKMLSKGQVLAYGWTLPARVVWPYAESVGNRREL